MWKSNYESLTEGHLNPFSLWALSVIYVLLPLLAGYAVGNASVSGNENVRLASSWLIGPDPAPRAWDHLFQRGRNGWVRIKLKSGRWIGGAFATEQLKSYAAQYPEAQDLFLARSVTIDPDTGAFIFDDSADPDDAVGLLVRWDEVEYLEFIEG